MQIITKYLEKILEKIKRKKTPAIRNLNVAKAKVKKGPKLKKRLACYAGTEWDEIWFPDFCWI